MKQTEKVKYEGFK